MIKQEIKLEDYKNCLENNKIKSMSHQRFRSETYNVFTEKFIEHALNSNDDKRLQTLDRVALYLHCMSAGTVCKT